MKRRLLSCLILLSSIAAFGQISYEKDYATALKKARVRKTPLFIYITPDSKVPAASYTSGINLPEVVKFYEENFTSLRLPLSLPETNVLTSKYQINRYPCYLFLDTNENLLFRWFNNDQGSKFYLDLGEEVLQRMESKSTIFQYEQRYANGQLSKDVFKDYINIRRKTGITNNAKLIEEYVKLLTIAELDNPAEILFILRAGPYAYGKAYSFAYNNNRLANETFMALPVQERIEINNSISENTINEAILTRSIQMAQQVSNFATNIHTDYKEGERQSAWKMISYFKGVGDTANFFRNASYYNDKYFMSVSIDSVKKAKAENQKNIDLIYNFRKVKPKVVKPAALKGTEQRKTTIVTSRIVTISGSSNNVSSFLNNAAWEFYQLGTKNSNHLSKALLWSKRSIEMDPVPTYYDTLAHIFYRMGLYDEALLNQNKAIDLTEKEPKLISQVAGLKSELNKMKERSL
jgi:tetratricopeptide (TPR) repeat protein